MVRRALQMFAWEVVIFRDKYREIGHLKGECNREIDLFRVMVGREFPIRSVKQATDLQKACFWRTFDGFCMPERLYLCAVAGSFQPAP
jgi:hypothetical protein